MRAERLIMSIMLLAVASLSRGELKWLETVHDFGAFSEDLNTVQCVFRAVNIGNEDVGVVSSRANCGCTVPKVPKGVIAPGDTLMIPVEYNAIGRPGRFVKKVFIDTSDGGKITLIVRGTVIGVQSTLVERYPVGVGKVRISGTVVPFGSTKKGRNMSGGINIYNSTDAPIKPRVEGLPEYIRAEFRPAQIEVGEQGSLSLVFSTARCGEWGTVVDSFTLYPDDNNESESMTISTVGIINEDFSKMSDCEKENAPKVEITPSTIDFAHIGGGKEISKTLTIKNVGKSPMLIRRIETAEKAITLGEHKGKVGVGESVSVDVKLNPEKLVEGEPLNAKIQIITNAPETPVVGVRVVGTH